MAWGLVIVLEVEILNYITGTKTKLTLGLKTK